MRDEQSVIGRLSELRAAQPADSTVRNLIEVLQAKLELSSRLPVLAFEAEDDGDPEGARIFRSLVASEKRQIAALLDGLRTHLEELQKLPVESPAGTSRPL